MLNPVCYTPATFIKNSINGCRTSSQSTMFYAAWQSCFNTVSEFSLESWYFFQFTGFPAQSDGKILLVKKKKQYVLNSTEEKNWLQVADRAG